MHLQQQQQQHKHTDCGKFWSEMQVNFTWVVVLIYLYIRKEVSIQFLLRYTVQTTTDAAVSVISYDHGELYPRAWNGVVIYGRTFPVVWKAYQHRRGKKHGDCVTSGQ